MKRYIPYLLTLTCAAFLGLMIGFGSDISQSGGAIQASGGSFSVNGFYLNDGTNNYIGAQQNIATLPSLGGFSWLTTQGTASAATVRNALQMTSPSVGGNAVRCFGTVIGSNTTLTLAQSFEAVPTNFVHAGVAFYESGTGKLEVLNTQWNTIASGSAFSEVDRYTNSSNFSSSVFSAPWGTNNGDLRWYRLQISGGNISFFYSTDGQAFSLLYTEASNAFFTTAPDNWCLESNPIGTQMVTTLYSWNPQP